MRVLVPWNTLSDPLPREGQAEAGGSHASASAHASEPADQTGSNPIASQGGGWPGRSVVHSVPVGSPSQGGQSKNLGPTLIDMCVLPLRWYRGRRATGGKRAPRRCTVPSADGVGATSIRRVNTVHADASLGHADYPYADRDERGQRAKGNRRERERRTDAGTPHTTRKRRVAVDHLCEKLREEDREQRETQRRAMSKVTDPATQPSLGPSTGGPRAERHRARRVRRPDRPRRRANGQRIAERTARRLASTYGRAQHGCPRPKPPHGAHARHLRAPA